MGDFFIEIDGSGVRMGKDILGFNEFVFLGKIWDVFGVLGI